MNNFWKTTEIILSLFVKPGFCEDSGKETLQARAELHGLEG